MAGERALPGMGLFGFYTAGSDGWATNNDASLRKVSALAQLSVISRVTSLPGSPVNGNIYIVPDGGNINKIAVRDNGQWVYLDPFFGLIAYVQDTGDLVVYDGAGWGELLGFGRTKIFTLATTSNTITRAHVGHTVELNSASANALNIPPQSTLAIPDGAFINFRQIGAGLTTLTAGAGVTINSRNGLKSGGQWAEFTIQHRTGNVWSASGDLASV